MNAALRIQSTLFCLVALGMAAGADRLMPPVDGTAGLLVIGGLILFLGVPHGALDPVFARHLHRLRSMRGWMMFGLCYGLAAGLVVLFWRGAPTMFLLTFLLMSAVHFAGNASAGVPWHFNVLYGGAIIVLPALLHDAQIEPLFSALVGPTSAREITRCLHWLAMPWLAGIGATTWMLARDQARSARELLALACLALWAPPLYAFTTFFCLMHSARHVLRTIDYAHDMRTGHLIALAALPMALVVAVVAAIIISADVRTLDAVIVQTVFVGLAALTVPHMALIERVRQVGWTRSDSEPDALS